MIEAQIGRFAIGFLKNHTDYKNKQRASQEVFNPTWSWGFLRLPLFTLIFLNRITGNIISQPSWLFMTIIIHKEHSVQISALFDTLQALG